MSLDVLVVGGIAMFNNPIGTHKADQLVRMLELQPEGYALDAGCGSGEFLVRVVTHHQTNGVGVDLDPRCISAARETAAARAVASRCAFYVGDVNEHIAAPHSFDFGICLGSTYAFGEGDAAYPGRSHG
ncbi:MAG: class I SAM-dependent methyltransferase [Burkholderiales bacterium]|nr:class I SAM-dependent methyltransferase [Phycisphaerae bacterium]